MRITNGIMINNNLSNINKNKVLMDKIMTQINSTKKIQRPSEDPILAIRALRLRSTHNEILQYEKNIADADAWMKVTADALDGVSDVLGDIILNCNTGVNEYNTVEEYEAIVTTIKQFRTSFYSVGNSDCSDRRIFTGYKTDSTLTFTKDDDTISYNITEKVNFNDIDNINRVVGVTPSDIETLGTVYVGTDVVNEKLNILKTAYNDVDMGSLTITPSVGTVQIRSYEANGQSVYDNINDNEVYFVPETGELIFGDNVYDGLVDQNFSITYDKTGFKEGDLKPEHYFDCVKTETIGSTTEVTTYTEKNQLIDYNVSFNQTLTVNVQGKDVMKHNVGRDLDEIIKRLEATQNAIEKIDRIKSKIASNTNPADKVTLDSLLEAAELELAYSQENVKNSFADGIKIFKEHQQVVSVEVSDLAARMSRLSLVKDRLAQQSLTVEELKSINEDTDIPTAAVEYNAISDVYDAALMTAAKVVQKSLLDFI